MNQINALLQGGFKSSAGLTPEFKAFAKLFKKHFTAELATANAELLVFNVGHFYLSGFFKLETGKIVYFSLPDVRSWKAGDTYFGRMLFREAKDVKDFTGGQNRYVFLIGGMAKAMRDQFTMTDNKISFLVCN